MLASHVIGHVIDHVTVRIFVVVYSWVDPINTLCSSAHHDCQQHGHPYNELIITQTHGILQF